MLLELEELLKELELLELEELLKELELLEELKLLELEELLKELELLEDDEEELIDPMFHPNGILESPRSLGNVEGLINVPDEATRETQLVVALGLFQSVKLTSILLNEIQPLNI